MGLDKEKNNNKKDIDYVPLSEAAKRTGYTPEYLNSLCRKGELEAKKIGRNWYTTFEWLKNFLKKTDKAELIKALPLKEEKENKKNVFPVSLKEREKELSDVLEVARELKEVVRIEKTENSANNNLIKKSSHSFFYRLSMAMTIFLVLIPFGYFGAYMAEKYFFKNANQENTLALNTLDKSPAGVILNENQSGLEESISKEIVNGVVKAGETTAEEESAKKTGALFSSENFKASQMSLGGGMVLATTEETQPLEIYDIKSESFITGKKEGSAGDTKEEVKLVVSWKTNKLAMSELAWSKNNGQDPKSVSEGSFGFNHAIVLTQIEPRTSYVYKIKGRDHWGTEVDSDSFGIFTASKPVSVFDLISNQINDIFGWAISGK